MNELQIFNNAEFGEIRTLQIDGEPWFVGKDVALILGYENPSKALFDHVDEDDKLNNKTLSSLGQRGGWLINESGLYTLIFGSRLETARTFKRWVTSEVLPTIRKTGGYVAGYETDFIIKTATQAAVTTVMEQLPAIVSEVTKAVLENVIIPQSNATAPKPILPRKRRIQYHGKIDHLPSELRNEVIAMIFQKNFTYFKVSEMLAEAGHDIGYSSVQRYAKRISDSVGDMRDFHIEEA